jgi:sugar phosphate isomerase/epimerase
MTFSGCAIRGPRPSSGRLARRAGHLESNLMIRTPVARRINAHEGVSPRAQIQDAARLGARGIVIDAAGELAPHRLTETGRLDLRHLLRTAEIPLVALHLPTRRSFDTPVDLDDRLSRASQAFVMAYELGARQVLVRVGPIAESAESPLRQNLTVALRELAGRATHRGVRLALEAGGEPATVMRALLDQIDEPALAASIDPASFLALGIDPAAAVVELSDWVTHAYATDPRGPARSGRSFAPHPGGVGYPRGAFDWEAYLGSLEEVDYRGFLTIWPDPVGDQDTQFLALLKTLERF